MEKSEETKKFQTFDDLNLANNSTIRSKIGSGIPNKQIFHKNHNLLIEKILLSTSLFKINEKNKSQ